MVWCINIIADGDSCQRPTGTVTVATGIAIVRLKLRSPTPHPPLTAQCSVLSAQCSVLNYSPLTTHHSSAPLTTHHSPLRTHYSIAHHPPPTTHHPPPPGSVPPGPARSCFELRTSNCELPVQDASQVEVDRRHVLHLPPARSGRGNRMSGSDVGTLAP